MNLKQFLGGMEPEVFMKEYWMKKPLLIKNAVDGADTFIQSDELRSLVENDYIESRVVVEEGRDKPWKAYKGPFTNEKLNEFNDSKWSLVTHGLNHHYTQLADLEKLVEFLPKWLFDDIMVTYSQPFSSVGPHIDHYNVFILQGKGKKRWQLEEGASEEYREGLDLRILKNFDPTIDWTLEPGDMVYIPPSVAHHGIPQEEGYSISIGFKAFGFDDIVSGFFQNSLEEYKSEDYFKNFDQKVVKNPYEIDDACTDLMMSILQKELFNKDVIKHWLGKYMTEPRYAPEMEDDVTYDEFCEELEDQRPLFRGEYIRFNFVDHGDTKKLFVNGFVFDVTTAQYQTIEGYLSVRAMDSISYDYDSMDESVIKILFKLFEKGAVFLSE